MTKHELLALFGILALGTALRLVGLDVQSLWHDELFSWFASAQPTLTELFARHAEDVHPPGHALLLRGWTTLFGSSPVALRSLSAVAGIATLPALHLLGRRLDGPGLGLRMAALGAVAWMPVWYSQETRPYALLLLAVVLVALCVPADGRLSPGRAVALGLSVAAAAWVHYFGLLFGSLALGFTVLSRWRTNERPPLWPVLLAAGVAVLAWAPWLATLLHQVRRGEVWIPPVTLAGLAEVARSLAQGHPLLAAGLLVAGLAACRRRRDLWGLGLLWLLAPVLAAVVVSLVVLPVVTDRNLIIALPGLLLLLALALQGLDLRLGRGPVVTGAVLAALLLDLVVLRDHYRAPVKPDYRHVATYLMGEVQPGEPVLANVWHRAYLDYFFDRAGSDLELTATSIRPRDRDRLLADRPQRAHVADPITPSRKHRCRLRQAGYRVTCTSLTGWDLYLLERDLPTLNE